MRWRSSICQSRRNSFGPNNDLSRIEEKIFLLMYYGGFTYTEARSLPIYKALWYVERINKEFKKTNDEGDPASRGAHNNTPETREMQGRNRTNVPSRLTRFT